MKYLFVVLLWVTLPAYAEYSCPLCQVKVEQFVEGGSTFKRNNCRCPECNGLERHRHLWLVLQQKHPELFTKKNTVLHWAPEPILAQKFLAMDTINYIAGDMDPEGLAMYFAYGGVEDDVAFKGK